MYTNNPGLCASTQARLSRGQVSSSMYIEIRHLALNHEHARNITVKKMDRQIN